ncbi:MAG: energy-coupling factor transporter transmembrane protein EcfT [Fibrobacter sp.]|nr:energy-coupling factor transporter transmembrane protein EcfT [Fibrobacter sp.]
MRDFHQVWGCADGPLKSLNPHIKIVSGLLTGIAVLLLPHNSITGLVALLCGTILWCSLSSLPLRMVLQCAIASLMLFSPFLLLTPWINIQNVNSSPLDGKLAHALGIALRSTCTLFIAASTVTIISINDVHRGLVLLRIPESFTALVVQLINQTMLLLEETSRITEVLRFRGTSGVKGWRVLFSFPVVWMVRVLFRAERSAAAMAVRGYGINTSLRSDPAVLHTADFAVLVCTSLYFAFSIVLRLVPSS